MKTLPSVYHRLNKILQDKIKLDNQVDPDTPFKSTSDDPSLNIEPMPNKGYTSTFKSNDNYNMFEDSNEPDKITSILDNYINPEQKIAETRTEPIKLDEKEKSKINLGTTGTLIKSLSPAVFSLIDAISTKPNVNTYEDYGRRGLEQVEKAKARLEAITDSGIDDIKRVGTTQKDLNSNSVRSNNVKNALNLSSDLGVERSISSAVSDKIAKLTQLDLSKTDLLNKQDEVLANSRDITLDRDKQDISKIISNSNKAATAVGDGMEHLQAIKNQDLYNDDALEILNTISTNVGVMKDKNGRIKIVLK